MKLLLPLFALVLVCSAIVSGQTQSTPDDIKTQVAATPCSKNNERLLAAKELFTKAGATPDDMRVENEDHVENLLVTKKGKTTETVIVGAHYDKVDKGCGAIDNWTGIIILTDLYRAMRALDTDKTFIFVAFGREEEGLLGSKAMAEQIKKGQGSNYCAMVNFDSFGFAYPQAVTNMSSDPLIQLAASVSKELKIPFSQASIDASADSQSFIKKIPAITLHGLDSKWPSYLHTTADTTSNVNAQSVYVGYRHGLLFLTKIDTSPCDAFRK